MAPSAPPGSAIGKHMFWAAGSSALWFNLKINVIDALTFLVNFRLIVSYVPSTSHFFCFLIVCCHANSPHNLEPVPWKSFPECCFILVYGFTSLSDKSSNFRNITSYSVVHIYHWIMAPFWHQELTKLMDPYLIDGHKLTGGIQFKVLSTLPLKFKSFENNNWKSKMTVKWRH